MSGSAPLGLTTVRALAFATILELRRRVWSVDYRVFDTLTRLNRIARFGLHTDPQGVLEDELRDDSLDPYRNTGLHFSQPTVTSSKRDNGPSYAKGDLHA